MPPTSKVRELRRGRGERHFLPPHRSRNGSPGKPIGAYLLDGILPRTAGTEAVDVRFSDDMNGVLDVRATSVSTGETATFTLEREGLIAELTPAQGR